MRINVYATHRCGVSTKRETAFRNLQPLDGKSLHVEVP
jgi:hypothetical protein